MRLEQPGPDSSTVAVIGLGKIGLPLAAKFADKGMSVIGCDVMPQVVNTVNAGRSHIHEEAGLAEAVAAAVKAGRLKATQDTSAAVAQASTVVVIVPLMIDPQHQVDYRHLDSAIQAIGRGLKAKTLVAIETTLPVGTTRNRIGPMLESESGLKMGSGFHLAFSPERLYAGRIFEDLQRYPKIVGGIDAKSTERAVTFYRRVLDADVLAVENAETAEFAKLAETTYRDLNIALANQLALYGASRKVNVQQAFKAANTQPFSHLHRPGIGVGGHCIPVYPHFLLSDASEAELELIRIGRQTNDSMAAAAIDSLRKTLGGLEGRRVLVLGAAYREGVKELAFSSAIRVIEQLRLHGAIVLIHDPLFEPAELAGLEAEVADLDGAAQLEVDAVVIQSAHKDYANLDWRRFRNLKAVFDGRGAVDPARIHEVGARYLAVGVANSAS